MYDKAGVIQATPVELPVYAGAPTTITVIPGAGCSVQVEYTTTPVGIAPHAETWQVWPLGTVSAITTDVFAGRLLKLRFTRMSGAADCFYEVLA